MVAAIIVFLIASCLLAVSLALGQYLRADRVETDLEFEQGARRHFETALHNERDKVTGWERHADSLVGRLLVAHEAHSELCDQIELARLQRDEARDECAALAGELEGALKVLALEPDSTASRMASERLQSFSGRSGVIEVVTPSLLKAGTFE